MRPFFTALQPAAVHVAQARGARHPPAARLEPFENHDAPTFWTRMRRFSGMRLVTEGAGICQQDADEFRGVPEVQMPAMSCEGSERSLDNVYFAAGFGDQSYDPGPGRQQRARIIHGLIASLALSVFSVSVGGCCPPQTSRQTLAKDFNDLRLGRQ
ncbi:uncharacterized protein PHACADRAFT_262331 [Phanerochaete carnosa HHB-10118-sp]|uniref:Uncharacterized protein n=1 Tax=Phanerochaete carnosa (strain HHB-10118-sp) TaxID=650164 RepID=K5VKK1_PHACS|nr:uncharacterized protein PHACADRAFT_262331 [Phanerochaete carnosa HHB-10118-sp]EKM51918.1 hypothetical protein PHACADRAFT_262331 [Phanerochaete carnosa HHB-10118-sp]